MTEDQEEGKGRSGKRPNQKPFFPSFFSHAHRQFPSPSLLLYPFHAYPQQILTFLSSSPTIPPPTPYSPPLSHPSSSSNTFPLFLFSSLFLLLHPIILNLSLLYIFSLLPSDFCSLTPSSLPIPLFHAKNFLSSLPFTLTSFSLIPYQHLDSPSFSSFLLFCFFFLRFYPSLPFPRQDATIMYEGGGVAFKHLIIIPGGGLSGGFLSEF